MSFIAIASTIGVALICLMEIVTSNRQNPGRRQK